MMNKYIFCFVGFYGLTHCGTRQPVTRPIQTVTASPIVAPPTLYRTRTTARYTVSPVPTQSVCLGNTPPARERVSEMHFAPITVLPIDDGPLISERARQGVRRDRTATTLTEHVSSDWGDRLKQCYRWARFQDHSLQGNLEVTFDINEFGAVQQLQVQPRSIQDRPLIDCVTDVLADLSFQGVSSIQWRASMPITFAQSGQAIPSRRPARPTRITAPQEQGERRCFSVPITPQQQPLAEPLSIHVTDFDEAQAQQERHAAYQRELRNWQRTGRHGEQRQLPPRIRREMPSPPSGMPRNESGFLSNVNRGAFNRCYAQNPDQVPGMIQAQVSFDRLGTASSVRLSNVTSGTISPALEQCLQSAFRELWFNVYGDQVSYTMVFQLSFNTIENVSSRPDQDTLEHIEQYALEDIENYPRRALQEYSALLEQIPEHPRRCLWYTGAIRALYYLAPWHDTREQQALSELNLYMQNHRDIPVLHECEQQQSEIERRIEHDRDDAPRSGAI